MAVSSTTSGIVDPSSVTLAMQHDPRLYNEDLAPTTAVQRTWGTYNYIALWFSMSMEVTTYMLASSLIAGGMNWKQAIFTILLGNLIVLVPMLLNAHAGAKYGIPFPVFVRASFGTRGANLPAMLRSSCGLRMVWNSVVAWWTSDRRNDRCFMACDGSHAFCFMGEFSWILAAQYVRGVARGRIDSVSAEFFGALHAHHVVHPALLDAAQGGWVWANALCA
jgi:Permease for cytosine/purines, uracil, thiamine, allantoin